jgi:glycosyltransferase involved in cell wall biosynthesis
MSVKLSAAIATFNEQENIGDCLESIKGIVDEIIIVDGSSTDQTVEIAKRYSAKITIVDNPPIFHINKQKAFDKAEGEWVLYLDADERVSKRLGEEILKVTAMSQEEIEDYQQKLKKRKLFLRHLKVLEERDGKIGMEDGEYAAFFFPRLNYFLGKFLRYGGVYPDGVIRLFRNKKAYLPAKDVHEQMVVLGRVGWLENDLIHYDSKTFSRYLQRNSRYIDLLAEDFEKQQLKKTVGNFIDYMVVKPIYWFLMTSLRNKGILDGFQGLVFSFFSALRFPRAYWRYIYK